LGLLHPLVVKATSQTNEEGGKIYDLVAGERRLHAIRSIYDNGNTFKHDGATVPTEFVPVTNISLGDAASIFEAELHENIIRVDLDWQDRVRAMDDLHKLKVAQNPAHTISDTVKEIHPENPKASQTHKLLSHAKIIVERLDDPAVAAARSEKEAYKIASRLIEAEFVKDMVERGLRAKTKHVLLHMSVSHGLIGMEKEHFDLIIADPPFGMGSDKFGDAAKLGHEYDDSTTAALNVAYDILHFGWKVAKPDAHLYMFCDIEQFINLYQMAGNTGWTPFRTPIIWHKTGGTGHAPIGDRGLRRSYELILFASKGNKTFPTLFSDVISVPPDHDKIHAAQKPVELYKQLIERSCLPLSTVLDPCCGSGTIFPAAEAANCTGYGIELDEATHDLAQVRLSEIND